MYNAFSRLGKKGNKKNNYSKTLYWINTVWDHSLFNVALELEDICIVLCFKNHKFKGGYSCFSIELIHKYYIYIIFNHMKMHLLIITQTQRANFWKPHL